MKSYTALIAVVAAAAGCRPAADEVTSYSTPKSAAPAAVERVTPPAEGSPVRTLAVIAPVTPEASRFVKVNGPLDRVTAVEPAFRAFAESLTFSDTPQKTLEFRPPAGWVRMPDRQMRQATFQAGEPGQKVEVYISDVFGGDVLSNVNRWRKEVSLEEVAAEKLSGSTKPLTSGVPNAVYVDLTGTAPAGGTGMRPPFAK